MRLKIKAAGEPRRKPLEHLSRNGAQELSAVIRKYWMDRGATVMTWLEPVYGDEHGTMYAIRSNMVGGLPP